MTSTATNWYPSFSHWKTRLLDRSSSARRSSSRSCCRPLCVHRRGYTALSTRCSNKFSRTWSPRFSIWDVRLFYLFFLHIELNISVLASLQALLQLLCHALDFWYRRVFLIVFSSTRSSSDSFLQTLLQLLGCALDFRYETCVVLLFSCPCWDHQIHFCKLYYNFLVTPSILGVRRSFASYVAREEVGPRWISRTVDVSGAVNRLHIFWVSTKKCVGRKRNTPCRKHTKADIHCNVKVQAQEFDNELHNVIISIDTGVLRGLGSGLELFYVANHRGSKSCDTRFVKENILNVLEAVQTGTEFIKRSNFCSFY